MNGFRVSDEAAITVPLHFLYVPAGYDFHKAPSNKAVFIGVGNVCCVSVGL